jgi:hypothetical protein
MDAMPLAARVQPVVPLYGPLRSTSSLRLFDTSQFAKAQPYVRGPSAFGLVHGLLFFSSHHCFPLVKFPVLIEQHKHLSPFLSLHECALDTHSSYAA